MSDPKVQKIIEEIEAAESEGNLTFSEYLQVKEQQDYAGREWDWLKGGGVWIDDELQEGKE